MRNQKRKAYDKSGGDDWKSKILKVINTESDLKSIILTMATEEQKNQAIITEFSKSVSQVNVPALIVPPTSPSIEAITSSATTIQSTANVATLVQSYPETTLKLKSILNRRGPPPFPMS